MVPAWSASPAYAVAPLPAFTSSVHPLDDALKARMTYSWRRGCPVKRTALRYVQVSIVGFDGDVRQGELVVHRSVAARRSHHRPERGTSTVRGCARAG